MAKLEAEFQNKVLKPAIKRLLPDCIILKNDELQIQGIPDLLVINGSLCMFIECKRSSKASFRPNQEWWINHINETGGVALVAYPENIEDVLDSIKEYFLHG